MRPLKKTKRIAPADAGAFFEEAEKPCASGKIFCVKNGGSACYFGAAVLIYKYHSNVPGRVVCFGKAGKVFSTEYADRGAGLMRTRNNGQAAVSGRGGTAEGAAACLGGVSWAVGEYPADCHKICGALSRRIFQRRLRDVYKRQLPFRTPSGRARSDISAQQLTRWTASSGCSPIRRSRPSCSHIISLKARVKR